MDAVDKEFIETQQAATDYASRHHLIEQLAWPDGARIAVNMTADFDAMLLRRVHDEPIMQMAKGEFGGRVGIWRLLELFAAHAIKATVFTPGRICELYPRAVRAIADEGHEVADHMWEHRVVEDPGLEERQLKLALDALEKTTGGIRPVGSRSWQTPAMMRRAGLIYNSFDSPDTMPHYIDDADGNGTMLNLPFHLAMDDAMYFSFTWYNTENASQRMADPLRVEEIWWAAFQQQYEAGGYLNICLHPFVSGRSMRIAMLDRLLTRMKKRPGVWFATCEQVARHCLKISNYALERSLHHL